MPPALAAMHCSDTEASYGALRILYGRSVFNVRVLCKVWRSWGSCMACNESGSGGCVYCLDVSISMCCNSRPIISRQVPPGMAQGGYEKQILCVDRRSPSRYYNTPPKDEGYPGTVAETYVFSQACCLGWHPFSAKPKGMVDAPANHPFAALRSAEGVPPTLG